MTVIAKSRTDREDTRSGVAAGQPIASSSAVSNGPPVRNGSAKRRGLPGWHIGRMDRLE